MSEQKMKRAPERRKPLRLRLPRVLDVVLVSDPEQISWFNQRPEIERRLDPSSSWLHALLERRMRVDLGFGGMLLPVFLSRSDQQRADRKEELERQLEKTRGMPGQERDLMARFVSGETIAGELGPLVQQWCGRLFRAHYRSTSESYEAGRLLAGWPSAPPWKTVRARISGRLERAKRIIAAEAQQDLYCVHATSIGMENIVRTLQRLRKAAHAAPTKLLSPDEILRVCLVAPPAVLRGVKSCFRAPFLARPLEKQTLVVLLVARAYAETGDLDTAFLAGDWSACPAREVVPEMLRGVWHAAHHDEAPRRRAPFTLDTWSRLLQRAVS